MELGKVWNVKLDSSDETTSIISTLGRCDENHEIICNTICILDWISIWQGKEDKNAIFSLSYHGERAFCVSLYVSRFPNSKNIISSGLTFTKIKRYFPKCDYKVEDGNRSLLIKEIYKGINENLDISVGEEIDYEFELSFIMKAQTWKQRNDEGYGKTSDYYIIGAKLRRWY